MTKEFHSFLPDQARIAAAHPPEKLLKLSVVALRLGISVITLRRWIDRGLLKPVCIRGRYYFEPAELRAFIARQRAD